MGRGIGAGLGPGPLTQDAIRSRVWGRRAKLTGSRAAPARPAPNEAPSMASPGGPRAPGALCPSVRRAGPARGRPGLLPMLPMLPLPSPPSRSARRPRRGRAGRDRAYTPPSGPRAQGWSPHLPPPCPPSTPPHPLSPQDQGPRQRPSTRSPSGGGVKGLSPPRPLTSSQESAGQVDTGLSLCRSHVGGQTDMTPLLCTGPFPECLRR